MKFFAHSDGHDFEVDIQPDRDCLRVTVNGRERIVAFDEQKWSIRTAFLGDRRLDFGWDRRDGVTSILIDGIEYQIVVRDPKSELLAKTVAGANPEAAQSELRAPIPGLITQVLAKPGQTVKKDQPLVCLDAMKLENEIRASRDGVVRTVEVQPGQAVEKGQVLLVIG